jgi:hypothetical protein
LERPPEIEDEPLDYGRGQSGGPWLLPDWEQAVQHYDGVQIIVGGAVAGQLQVISPHLDERSGGC